MKGKVFSEEFSQKYGSIARTTEEFMSGKDASCLLGEELYEYFKARSSLGKTQFYRLRNCIIDYVRFVNHPDEDKIINRISNASQAQVIKHISEKISTYNSLDDVLSLIENMAISSSLNPTDALPMQSIAILMWFGYSNEEIIEFKVEDIDKSNKIDDKFKNVLKAYAELNYYRALPTGKMQYLKRSNYLFRTAKTNKMTYYDIKKAVSKIGYLIADYTKNQRVFNRSVLQRSASFVKMYQLYKTDVSTEIIKEYFGKSKNVAEINSIIIAYKKWAEQLK